MNWGSMSGLAAVSFVHISPAVFEGKGDILREENSDKMRLLRKAVLFHP